MIPFADILVALKWLIAIYLCCVLGSLIFMKKGSFAGLRYSVGKAVGLIGIAGLTWYLSVFKIMSFSATTIIIVLAAAYALVLYFRWASIVASLKQNWILYLRIELLFVSLFVVGILFRSLIPKIEGIEKFMDAAILSNLMRHGVGVPVDTWYAPSSLNYYYFGHWIVAVIAKMTGTTIGYAFNLGFATSLAITGTSIFCLAWTLSKRMVGGFLALFLALFASNLHPFISIIGGNHSYFFFNSGRFIETAINEYPLYSLILGDLHAHMLSLMITTAFYGLVALLIFSKEIKDKIIFAVLDGLMVGFLGATNSFDVISGGLVFTLALAWLFWRKKATVKQLVILAIGFGAAFVFVLGTFLLHFKPAVGGIAFSVFKTPFIHMIWQFGVPIGLLVVSGLLLLHQKHNEADRKKMQIALMLGIAGLILMLLPQFIYFKDIYYYENPSFARANTVFKLWYAAWPLIAIAAAVLTTHMIGGIKKAQNQFVGWMLVLVCSAVLSFGLGVGLKTLNDSRPNTLDGTAYLKSENVKKLDAISWVTKNIKDQPMVAQAYGESYSQQSWFSSYTGLSSILGWREHEWGWRYSAVEWGSILKRSDALKRLYESANTSGARQAASQASFDYVLVGPDERELYLVNDNAISGAFGAPVYQNGLYKLYSTK